MTEQLENSNGEMQAGERPFLHGHLIRRAQQIAGALWAEHVGGALTSPQYAVLSSLYSVPSMDQVSITQAAALDRSTLADVLSRLESRQLVTRSRDKFDARRNLVSLTDSGRQLVKSVTPAVAALEQELIACFSESEREAFLGQLRSLIDHGEQRLGARGGVAQRSGRPEPVER